MNEFEKVKMQFNLLDVAGRYTHMAKAGKEYVGLCPLHSENTPSFYVNKEKQQFHCKGCGVGGDVIELVRLINFSDAYTALEILADEKGIDLNHTDKEVYHRRKEVQKKQTTLVNAAFQKIKEASEYIAGRGFTQETVNKFKLGYGKNHHSLIIPLVDHRGMDIGYCERFIGDPPAGFRGKYKLPSESDNELFKKSRFLFNEYNARRELKDDHMLLIFEGQLDAISASQVGFGASVACMQSSLTAEQAERVVKLAEENTVIVLVPDKNKTGQASIKQNANLLKSLNQKIAIKVLDLPIKREKNFKEWDMNDFVKNGWTKEQFLTAIIPIEISLLSVMMQMTVDDQLQRNYAIDLFITVKDSFVQEQIVSYLAQAWGVDSDKVTKLLNARPAQNLLANIKDIDDMYSEYLAKIMQSNAHNLKLGFTELDKVINSGQGIPTGWVVDFMARSGVGKTAFVLNVIDNVVRNHNVGATFFSFEQASSDVYPKLSAIRSSVAQKKLNYDYANFNGDHYHQEVANLYRGKLKVFDNFRLNLAEIESIINGLDEEYFIETPCKLVIIDYLGYIKTKPGTKYDAMSELTAELKQVAKRTGKVFLVLVQTNREGGNGSQPTKFSDARDSGTIEENADVLIGAYRPDLATLKDDSELDSRKLIGVTDDFMVQVLKNRNGPNNVTMNLKFDKPRQVIRDWLPGEKERLTETLVEQMQGFGSEEERMEFLRGGRI